MPAAFQVPWGPLHCGSLASSFKGCHDLTRLDCLPEPANRDSVREVREDAHGIRQVTSNRLQAIQLFSNQKSGYASVSRVFTEV